MTDLVPVKTWLKAATFRTLEREARKHHVDVGVLIAYMADRSIKTPPPAKRQWRRMTPELLEQARELAAQRIPRTEIARRLGVSRKSLYNHLTEEQG